MSSIKKIISLVVLTSSLLLCLPSYANDSANIQSMLHYINQTKGGVTGATKMTTPTPPKFYKPATTGNSVATSNSAATKDKLSEFGQTPVSRQAFIQTVRNMLPLTPKQIETLRLLLNRTQQAANQYPGTPPRPTSAATMVNLAPGSTPPIIRLRKGYITSLVFLDSTGAPWPIEAYDIGNPKAFNVQWNQKGNTLLVQALDTYKSGNLAVMLKGEDTPVMVTLMPGQAAVDYRVDLRVPGLGPNANPVLSTLPATQNKQLLPFLNGVPPHGAKTLTIQGGDCQAWLYGGHIYLRTMLTILSPSWLASMSSPDGTNVYEVPKTPIILASDRGQIVQLAVQGL